MRRPLNGAKTHPLSAIAVEALNGIRRAPQPYSAINPGIIDRLLRESLVEVVDLPSPFVSHKGKMVRHLRITSVGNDVLVKRMSDAMGRIP